jgi:hypothetical protein
MSGMELNESSARRGINELEDAGLIRVTREPGRGLLVTILEARDDLGQSDLDDPVGTNLERDQQRKEVRDQLFEGASAAESAHAEVARTAGVEPARDI